MGQPASAQHLQSARRATTLHSDLYRTNVHPLGTIQTERIVELKAEKEALLTSMVELKLQNEALRLQSKRNEFQIEQLNHNSVFELDQLQVEHLGAVIQNLQNLILNPRPRLTNLAQRQMQK